jgi:transcription antitermination factor NusG
MAREFAAHKAWYVLWTHSHCEQVVHDQLCRAGFAAFLPTIDVWSRRGGARHLIEQSMFPGYLFVHHAMDKRSYVELRKTRGLVKVLGERWDRLAFVPDEEIDAIRQVATSRERVLPYPYLRQGQRVRIAHGPLQGVEGILVQTRSDKGLLVVSVHMLQRSVAVVVDCTKVVPA